MRTFRYDGYDWYDRDEEHAGAGQLGWIAELKLGATYA